MPVYMSVCRASNIIVDDDDDDDSLSRLTRTHTPQSNQITRIENALTASSYMFVTQAQPLERCLVTQLTHFLS